MHQHLISETWTRIVLVTKSTHKLAEIHDISKKKECERERERERGGGALKFFIKNSSRYTNLWCQGLVFPFQLFIVRFRSLLCFWKSININGWVPSMFVFYRGSNLNSRNCFNYSLFSYRELILVPLMACKHCFMYIIKGYFFFLQLYRSF